ncbi:MAG: hypothetical protein PVI06_14865 [Desulfobacterales bacterium]|jgi:hypothetical protein
MPVLMIHDIRKEYFQLNLVDYQLAFDDGLFSQYYYHPLLTRYGTEMLYFIVTAFIKPGRLRKRFDGEYITYVKSRKYMYDAFIDNEFSHFMTLEEIQELSTDKRVKIGSHSHFHDVIIHDTPPPKPTSRWKIERCAYHPEKMNPNSSIRSKLAYRGFELRNGKLVARTETEWLDYIKYDTELTLKWFEENLGFVPEIYGLPFNEHSDRLIGILESFGFKEFYGKSSRSKKVHPRLDIDKLK